MLISVTSATRNQTESPLLRLSTELRNRIYDYGFDLPSEDYHHDNHNDWSRLKFSLVCRQIFLETASGYFTTKLLPLYAKGLFCLTVHVLIKVIFVLKPIQKKVVTKGSISVNQNGTIELHSPTIVK